MTYNKYGAKKLICDGIKYDSMAEHKRHQDLLWLEKGGHIDQLVLKPRFDLVVNGKKIGRYTADFGYHEVSTFKAVIEDVKGYASRDFILRFKLAQALFPQYEFRIYKQKG